MVWAQVSYTSLHCERDVVSFRGCHSRGPQRETSLADLFGCRPVAGPGLRVLTDRARLKEGARTWHAPARSLPQSHHRGRSERGHGEREGTPGVTLFPQ